jgi:hypothetical protein
MAVTQAMIDALFEPQTAETPAPRELDTSDRTHSRIPFRGRAPAVVFPPPGAKSEPVESEVLTTDISRGGLSLLHKRELRPGQQVMLQLARGNCTVEVCWCCRVWPGLYVAGCRFVDAAFTDGTL